MEWKYYFWGVLFCISVLALGMLYRQELDFKYTARCLEAGMNYEYTDHQKHIVCVERNNVNP